ncbi:MAG: SPASM domain-containing protein, partial [Nitrososphaerota archaeon]
NASVGIAMTVTKLNFKEVEEMVKLGEELNVKRVVFFNFIPTGRGKEITELDLSPREREEFLQKIYELSCKSRIQVASTSPQLARVSWQMSSGMQCIPTHFTPPKSQSLKALAEFIGGCGAGRIYAAIQPDGKISPCVFLPIIIGDLRKENFQEIWNNSIVLRKLRNRDLLEKPCGECPYRYVCGGCRARAYGYFGNYLAPDPGCLRGQMILGEVVATTMKSFSLHNR